MILYSNLCNSIILNGTKLAGYINNAYHIQHIQHTQSRIQNSQPNLYTWKKSQKAVAGFHSTSNIQDNALTRTSFHVFLYLGYSRSEGCFAVIIIIKRMAEIFLSFAYFLVFVKQTNIANLSKVHKSSLKMVDDGIMCAPSTTHAAIATSFNKQFYLFVVIPQPYLMGCHYHFISSVLCFLLFLFTVT